MRAISFYKPKKKTRKKSETNEEKPFYFIKFKIVKENLPHCQKKLFTF